MTKERKHISLGEGGNGILEIFGEMEILILSNIDQKVKHLLDGDIIFWNLTFVIAWGGHR